MKTIKLNQAQRIVLKFGGAYTLSTAMARVGHPINPCNIYRWTYTKGRHGDGGGMIPRGQWPAVVKAARNEGIILTSEDLDPRDVEVRADLVPHDFLKPVGRKGKGLKSLRDYKAWVEARAIMEKEVEDLLS